MGIFIEANVKCDGWVFENFLEDRTVEKCGGNDTVSNTLLPMRGTITLSVAEGEIADCSGDCQPHPTLTVVDKSGWEIDLAAGKAKCPSCIIAQKTAEDKEKKRKKSKHEIVKKKKQDAYNQW